MKIRPFYEMYNTELKRRFAPGVPVDVPDELGAEYIGAGLAEAVEEKARDEPAKPEAETPEAPDDNPEEVPEDQPEEVNDQPEAETPKKPRARKANNKQ